MFNNKTSLLGVIIVLLLLANIVNYFWSNWGVITIHAKDEPLGKVIKSIEWQGWVTIYSNIDPKQKITMDCDHVSLPEAMETLAVNADDGGGAGGGMRGGGAQWHLGFFVAPTSADVKQEIRTFTEGADGGDDTHVYNFNTPLSMLGDDSSSVSDPRKQIWPGLKMPSAPATPPPDAAFGMSAPPSPEAAPSSVQGYLRAFARQADVWIMAPATWDPPVANAPAPSGSIIAAIHHFVGSAHGSVREALILRGRPPRVAGDRPRGNFNRGGFDMSMMEDRVDNAINGLPREEQAPARAKLAEEKQYQKEMANIPPEQRMQGMMKHFVDRRMDSDKSWRRSPEKRAQMYSHMVQNRVAATGK